MSLEHALFDEEKAFRGYATDAVSSSVHVLTYLVRRVCMGYKMPSTRRNADMYRSMLFPDCATREQMHALLSEGNSLDIGSGLTHQNPYSAINEVARQDPDAGHMYGIDLRLGADIGSEKGFSRRNMLMDTAQGVAHDAWRLLTSRRVVRDTPARTRVLAADAKRLPFPDGAFRQVLSCYCYPFWIGDKDLPVVFGEMTRVSAPEGGQIRLFPMAEIEYHRLLDHTPISDLVERCYDIHLEKRDARYPTLILTRNGKETSGTGMKA